MPLRVPTLAAVLMVASFGRAAPPEEHWAWKPPVRPAAPVVRDPQPTNPIDAFIRARLDAAGVSPAPPATREQLIRRVTVDLTGLPPTPQEIDAFVNDKSPAAWETVIDRLLASPHYGERWGRHWLDLARYADTNGYEFDEPRPDAWRYRDYVIRSFNADKPFDRFAIEQLAGDEAFPGDHDALIATGFNLLGPDMTDASDQAQRRLNTLNDMTDTAGLAFLGLTIACARCHDHKFEPIPQTDYYRLQAFFAPAAFRRDLPIETSMERQAHEAAMRDYLAATKSIRDEIAALEGPHRTKLFEAKLAKLSPEAQAAHRTQADQRTGGQQELVAETERKVVVTPAEVAKAMPADDRAKLATLQEQLRAFDAKKPPALPVAMGLTDQSGPAPKTRLLERGELSSPAAEVRPGFLAVLSPGGKPTPAEIESVRSSTGRRLSLAKWVASPDNPLTARVIVNRLWQHHFGRGLVTTSSDFGRRGERPTYPELLDYLAVELVQSGWSLKHMHRLMLTSATYQQSSNSQAADPDNKLLSLMNRLRLEGEAVRDALLATSGRLNSTMGGAGVVLPEAATAAGGSKAVPVTTDARERERRSVYLFARRNLRHPFLEAFDLPDSNLSCPRRERSTTAPQALALLNAAEATAAARALADRLMQEVKSDDERIELAYRLTLGRAPTAAERDRAVAFLRESPLSEFCRALVNLNEFVYVD
ncbi:MAG TPA: DUF1549 and DUF1553 domain-containing protein [Gemmataceae bacterium]|nr:DUF1549 and DUF1553 domain-containing protein [Gemmataceae bacterium]